MTNTISIEERRLLHTPWHHKLMQRFEQKYNAHIAADRWTMTVTKADYQVDLTLVELMMLVYDIDPGTAQMMMVRSAATVRDYD